MESPFQDVVIEMGVKFQEIKFASLQKTKR